MSKLLIKSVSSIIPGFNDFEEGELISTEEILTNIRRSDVDSNKKSFDPTFLKQYLGFETIAFSKTSIEYVRRFWGRTEAPSSAELFSTSQSTQNISLVRMIDKAVNKAFGKLGEKESKVIGEKVVAHIHISGFFSPFNELEFSRIRKSVGIGLGKPIQTMMLQQGCAGLLTALEIAKTILSTKELGSNVVITSDNNMMIHAHQRCESIAGVDNINNWLWPAIFGEAAGCIIVGTIDQNNMEHEEKVPYFEVDHFEDEVIENDWRVAHFWKQDKQTSEVVVKAREVKTTYMKGITKHTTAAIERSGGLDSAHKVCLHESNPQMIIEMTNRLNIPREKVPSISSKVGTLACVSAFSLLDIAATSLLDSHKKDETNSNQSKIALSLIGEAGGTIIAGHICLSARL